MGSWGEIYGHARKRAPREFSGMFELRAMTPTGNTYIFQRWMIQLIRIPSCFKYSKTYFSKKKQKKTIRAQLAYVLMLWKRSSCLVKYHELGVHSGTAITGLAWGYHELPAFLPCRLWCTKMPPVRTFLYPQLMEHSIRLKYEEKATFIMITKFFFFFIKRKIWNIDISFILIFTPAPCKFIHTYLHT